MTWSKRIRRAVILLLVLLLLGLGAGELVTAVWGWGGQEVARW